MKARATMKAMLCAAGLALVAGQAARAAIPVPAPTPAQQQAAAAKKAQADAQAAKDKQELSTSMDAVTAHWRARASSQGWKSHPPVAIAAAGAAPAAAINTAASSNGPAGQPAGQLTPAGANLRIRSEKFGTAPPSTDVKAHPTQAQPAGAPPALVKGTPKVKNR